MGGLRKTSSPRGGGTPRPPPNVPQSAVKCAQFRCKSGLLRSRFPGSVAKPVLDPASYDHLRTMLIMLAIQPLAPNRWPKCFCFVKKVSALKAASQSRKAHATTQSSNIVATLRGQPKSHGVAVDCAAAPAERSFSEGDQALVRPIQF